MATTTIPCRKVYKFRMEPTGLEALELELGKSLVKTKHAKSWLDAAFGELLRQVEYKSPVEQQALRSGG